MLLALTLVYPAEARYHQGHKRPLYVSWKTVAAGGAAAGTVIAAYKVSNGIEDGLKTVAKEKPEVFSNAVSDLTSPIRWTLWLALIGIGYYVFRKLKPQKEREENGESIKNELVGALVALGKLVCRTSPVELYKTIRLQTVGSDLRLTTVGLNESLSVVLDAETDGPMDKIVYFAELKVHAINSCDIVPIFQEFQKPCHEEFSEATRWSLLNAFTEYSKRYSPGRSDICHRGLTRLFGLDGNKAELWR